MERRRPIRECWSERHSLDRQCPCELPTLAYLRVKPNTESLSANTTTSVVTSITLVILVDAIFAVTTRGMGIPQL